MYNNGVCFCSYPFKFLIKNNRVRFHDIVTYREIQVCQYCGYIFDKLSKPRYFKRIREYWEPVEDDDSEEEREETLLNFYRNLSYEERFAFKCFLDVLTANSNGIKQRTRIRRRLLIRLRKKYSKQSAPPKREAVFVFRVAR